MNYRSTRPDWLLMPCALFAAILLLASPASRGDDILTETFLPLADTGPKSPLKLGEQISSPTVVYIWQPDCGQCSHDLIAMDTLQQREGFEGYSVLTAKTLEGVSTEDALASMAKHLPALQRTQHLFNPYGLKQSQPPEHYRHLPQVRVYNGQGLLAAIYPKFSDQWPEIQRLVQRLKTPEFARYTMPSRDLTASVQQLSDGGNLLNLKEIEPRPDRHLPRYHYAPAIGARQSFQRPSHTPQLTQPFAETSLFATASDDIDPSWQGLNVALATALPYSRRFLLDAHARQASDYGNQLVGPGTDDPSVQSIAVGIEGFTSDVLYTAKAFYAPNEYRVDQGIDLHFEHLFWNERVKLEMGAKIYQAFFDESATIANSGKDHNREHRAGVSWRLNPQHRVAFHWHHNALQGLIENPNELVEFGAPGASGTQFALYPTTRTENIYILQHIWKDLSYGVSYFEDTWSRENFTLFGSAAYQAGQWLIDSTLSLSHQGVIKFYSDLFPRLDAQTLLSSNADFAAYDSIQLETQGKLPLGDGSTGLSLFGKKTWFIVGARIGYYDFETVSESRSVDRQPISNLALTTFLGIKVDL